MIFNSETFLVFAVAFFPLYFLCRTARQQHAVALIGSYIFYGWWDWRFLALIAFTSLFNYAVAPMIVDAGRRRQNARGWLALAVAMNLGILGVFKYFGFFVEQFAGLVETLGLGANVPVLDILLPVGISFFTFQAMSYVIDVYRLKLAPQDNLMRFATYIALFPQLVAGPIVRAAVLLPQLATVRRFRWANFWIGAEQVLLGAVLKIVIADRLAPLVDRIFGLPENHDGLGLVLGVLFFAFQIYGDFAGYSLMAIGLGRIMGLHFPVNFRRPYLAESFTDFWRRWHISLSSWLRDYLYIPLGGSRQGKAKTYRNLFTTMLLGGLWHGAGWTFVAWGGLHGGYLVVQRLLPLPHRPLGRGLSAALIVARRWVARLSVFTAVCLAWIFFRAEDFAHASRYIEGIVFAESFSPGALPNKFQMVLALVLIATLFLVETVYEDSRWARTLARRRWFRFAFALILLLSLPLLGSFSGNAFIYFQF